MKRTTLLLAAILLLAAFSAANATSLFSLQGVGTPVLSQNARSIALGGVDGPLADSLYLSVTNPAGWYNTHRTRFMVNSSLELTGANTNTGATANSDNFGFPSAGFSLPVYRGLGIGLSIQSTSDYKFYTKRSTTVSPAPEDTAGYAVSEVLQGVGGLSTASSNFGVKVNQSLAVGLAVDYVFGKLDRELTTMSDDRALSSGGFLEHKAVSGLAVRFGALGSIDNLLLSASIGLPAEIKVVQTLEVIGGDSVSLPSTNLQLPLSLAFGGSYRHGRILAVGEGKFQMWGNTTQEIGNADYTNSWDIGFGLERQRLVAPLLPWYDRVNYRIGAHINRLNVEANGKPIDGYGVAAGIGIPMRTHMGMLDLAATLDWRGSASNNGARERIIGFRLGITSTESWFIRRKR